MVQISTLGEVGAEGGEQRGEGMTAIIVSLLPTDCCQALWHDCSHSSFKIFAGSAGHSTQKEERVGGEDLVTLTMLVQPPKL